MIDVVLSDDQLHQFVVTGWTVVPGLVAPDVLDAIDGEVDRLMTDAPPPVGHRGQHFYWRSPDESPSLFLPLGGAGGVLAAGDELVGGGVEVAFDQAQVALNIPPFDHRPGRPHLDGYAPGQRTPGTFTLLAGLLLTDQLADNEGNLWVWPGTHLSHADYFAAHGPEAFAEAGGYPDIELPEPVQVHGRRGDVLLAHTCWATTSAATTRASWSAVPSTGAFGRRGMRPDGRTAWSTRGATTPASNGSAPGRGPPRRPLDERVAVGRAGRRAPGRP